MQKHLNTVINIFLGTSLALSIIFFIANIDLPLISMDNIAFSIVLEFIRRLFIKYNFTKRINCLLVFLVFFIPLRSIWILLAYYYLAILDSTFIIGATSFIHSICFLVVSIKIFSAKSDFIRYHKMLSLGFLIASIKELMWPIILNPFTLSIVLSIEGVDQNSIHKIVYYIGNVLSYTSEIIIYSTCIINFVHHRKLNKINTDNSQQETEPTIDESSI